MFPFVQKIVACLPKPTTEETFEFLSECSLESVTRLFLDDDVRNYCILVICSLLIHKYCVTLIISYM